MRRRRPFWIRFLILASTALGIGCQSPGGPVMVSRPIISQDSAGAWDTLPKNRFQYYASHDFHWTIYSLPDAPASSALVFDSSNIMALCSRLYGYDGRKWTQNKTVTRAGLFLQYLDGYQAFGFRADNYWIFESNIMMHVQGYDARETRLENTGVWQYPADGGINSGWGRSSTDMYFVGNSGTILHYGASGWSKYDKATPSNLLKIWGSKDDVWTCGVDASTSQKVLLHFDGIAWQVVNIQTSLSPTANISVGWTGDSASVPIQILAGDGLWWKTADGAWESRGDSLPVYSDANRARSIQYISGPNGNDLVFATNDGFVAHWNGHNWKRFDEMIDAAGYILTVNAVSFRDNTICVAGSKYGQTWLAVGRR